MDLLAKLTRLDLAPALLDDVRALLARVELAEQNAQLVAVMDGVLQEKERIIEAKESLIAVKESIIKIAALTLELAHHRRIRFAYKSEGLTCLGRMGAVLLANFISCRFFLRQGMP